MNPVIHTLFLARFNELLFKDNEVPGRSQIVSYADDVEAVGQGQMQNGTVMIVTLEAHHFIMMLTAPRLLRLQKLRRHPQPTGLRKNADEPCVIGCVPQFIPHEKTHRTLFHLRNHDQRHPMCFQTAAEIRRLLRRLKDAIIKLADQLQFSQTDHLDTHIRHVAGPDDAPRRAAPIRTAATLSIPAPDAGRS